MNCCISSGNCMKRKSVTDIFIWIGIGLLVIFAFWKTTLGMHSDEVHSIAVGDMIARGNSFFKECWFYLQMSAVFTAPIIFLYQKIIGNTDGILLFFRILSVCIQFGISAYFYQTFRKKYHKGYVLAASVILFTFVPDFQSFNYKQEMIWFAVMEIIFSYRYYESGKKRYIVLLGLMIAGSVLAYPTTILEFPVYLMLLQWIEQTTKRVKSGKAGKFCSALILTLTCVCCAAAFMTVVLSRITLQEFIYFFPKVFHDENLNSSFYKKLVHPVIKFAVIGLMTLLPIILCSRVKKLKNLVIKFHVPIAVLLLLAAFLVQYYVERGAVTWHCLTYPYALTIFLVPAVSVLRGGWRSYNPAVRDSCNCVSSLHCAGVKSGEYYQHVCSCDIRNGAFCHAWRQTEAADGYFGRS